VDGALAESALDEVLAARRTGPLSPALSARVRSADLLALGALADRIRAEDVGGEVRVYAQAVASSEGAVLVLPREGDNLTGLELLREVAVARVTLPRGAHVRVDWTRCGLELAQVALGFGADELVGFIATKRGLPIADGELAGVGKKSQRESAKLVKERELAGFIERAGRVPRFVRAGGSEDARGSDDTVGTTHREEHA
jgi:hypothetical protein